MRMKDMMIGWLRTWTGPNRIERAFLGLAGEVGEIMECRKKYLRGDYDHNEYVRRLTKEIPDAQFYLDMIAYESGVDKEKACKDKLDQLAARAKSGTIMGDGSDRV